MPPIIPFVLHRMCEDPLCVHRGTNRRKQEHPVSQSPQKPQSKFSLSQISDSQKLNSSKHWVLFLAFFCLIFQMFKTCHQRWCRANNTTGTILMFIKRQGERYKNVSYETGSVYLQVVCTCGSIWQNEATDSPVWSSSFQWKHGIRLKDVT